MGAVIGENTVYVGTKAYLPGEEVPDNVAKELGAHCFADGEARAAESGDGPPPKGGAGSGADAWAVYAEQNGVAVEDGASRDDIIAALDDAGVATE